MNYTSMGPLELNITNKYVSGLSDNRGTFKLSLRTAKIRKGH